MKKTAAPLLVIFHIVIPKQDHDPDTKGVGGVIMLPLPICDHDPDTHVSGE